MKRFAGSVVIFLVRFVVFLIVLAGCLVAVVIEPFLPKK